jgi:hypothetical protein
MNHLGDDLPAYRGNILAKIADIRGAGKGRIGREASGDHRRNPN